MTTRLRRGTSLFGPLATVTLLVLLPACSEPDLPRPDPQDHRTAVEAWDAERAEDLTAPQGWLTVIGLGWLEEGENPFGSDSSNYVRFPREWVPPRAGSFFLRNGVVRMEVAPEVEITHEGEPVTELLLTADGGRRTPSAWLGSLVWHVIEREGMVGIRLRDTANAARFDFQGIERYPITTDWVIPARFDRYLRPKTINVPNVLGMIIPQPSPGAVVFEVDGESYRLDVTGDPDARSFFIIFGDQTNGDESYPAGRFLYVDAPDESGRLLIDFNKAHNPPCAFTDYATCPLPPEQNVLPIRIEAGEKNFHH